MDNWRYLAVNVGCAELQSPRSHVRDAGCGRSELRRAQSRLRRLRCAQLDLYRPHLLRCSPIGRCHPIRGILTSLKLRSGPSATQRRERNRGSNAGKCYGAGRDI